MKIFKNLKQNPTRIKFEDIINKKRSSILKVFNILDLKKIFKEILDN